MNRRRFAVLAGLFAVAPAVVVRAQTEATGDCSIGFVNGLLQYSPDCPLLTPPGLGMEIAPPSHLALPPVDEAAADAAAQEAETEAQERLTNRRSRKDDRKNRRRDKKRDKRGRGTDRKQRRRDGRRARDDNAQARLASCDDFATKDELDAYWLEFQDTKDAKNLDPNGNGMPCEHIVWPPDEP